MNNFAKPPILLCLAVLLIAISSGVLTGTEKKDEGAPPATAPQTYTIDARYLLGCDLYNQGIKYADDQQYDKALGCFRKAVELLPKGHPGYVLSKIEIQRLTSPEFQEERKKKYEEMLTDEVTQQVDEIQEEARKIVGVVEQGNESSDNSQDQERERQERLKKAARQIALEIAIENLKRQIDQEQEVGQILAPSGGGTVTRPPGEKGGGAEMDADQVLRERIRALVDREFSASTGTNTNAKKGST